MPLLTYSVTDFVAFTKIRSADVNARFTDIKTLLNTTGLDDTNIQNAGITRATKLKTGTPYALVANTVSGAMGEIAPGTTGQLLGSNGTNWLAVSSPLTTQFNIVVGSSSQVTAGTATHSTFASITFAASDRVLVLPGYVGTENVTVNQAKVFITGIGPASRIDGTVTFSSASDESQMQNIRVTGDITLSSGADNVICKNIVLASGKTFLVDTAVVGEIVEATRE